MRVSNRVLRARRGGLWGGLWGGSLGVRAKDFSPLPPTAPAPPTAAVLAQILARSPDFSDCKRIVDGCVVLIVGIEGSAARTEEQVVGCVEERDGWHVDNHAVAPP